jgi:hypothetical protein
MNIPPTKTKIDHEIFFATARRRRRLKVLAKTSMTTAPPTATMESGTPFKDAPT